MAKVLALAEQVDRHNVGALFQESEVVYGILAELLPCTILELLICRPTWKYLCRVSRIKLDASAPSRAPPTLPPAPVQAAAQMAAQALAAQLPQPLQRAADWRVVGRA